ncbi:MAG: hypothetical protein ACYC2H_05125 [Thermoplasmatota archaeon]
MRRVLLVAAVSLLPLVMSGCSDATEGPEVDSLQAAAPEDISAAEALNLTAEPVVTDLLWLQPDARLGAQSGANLTILATLAGAFPQSFAWNATLNGTGNLSAARMVLWLDLQNSAAQPGVGSDPGCSAAMHLYVTQNGTQTYQAGGCASLGTGMVPPGEHRLEFSTLLTAFPDGALVAAGDGVLVQVQFGLSMPQGVGYLLGGADHDSHLRLVGLSEPVPTADGDADAGDAPTPA